ncbi:hypothetical protein IJG89_04210 [Candidatus Saccharibacteria bacterium]|nr:hypothetical protein [Candidatus Saccharibacteria bacterium]MBQ7040583.1 hypothetical protein [Candidatus Saccharibacteria bacterium]
MKYKKSLLSLATLGIFAGVGLLSLNTYAEEYIQPTDINIDDCSSDTYKVTQDYDAQVNVHFYIKCPTMTFDLNGKKIEQGRIWAARSDTNNTTFIDSVGGGYIKGGNNDYALFIDISEPNHSATVKSGKYIGGTTLYGPVNIEGGEFEGSLYSHWQNEMAKISGGRFNNLTLNGGTVTGGEFTNLTVENKMSASDNHTFRTTLNGGTYDGDINVKGLLTLIISNGTFNDNIVVDQGSALNISGGIFNGTISGPTGNVQLHGGSYAIKPDDKYLSDYQTFYEENGRYYIETKFSINEALNYMYTGQVAKVYAVPPRIVKTMTMTSSDESVLAITYRDVSGQMEFREYDFTARKAGKAMVSYTTDAGYEGSFMIYITDVDASDYGNAADSIRYSLMRATTIYNTVTQRDENVTISGDATEIDTSKMQAKYNKVAEAVQAGKKLKLTLSENSAELTDEQKNLVDDAVYYTLDSDGKSEEHPVKGMNIAAVYELSSSLIDANTGVIIVDEIIENFAISRLSLPDILKNRSRTLAIASLYKDSGGNYAGSSAYAASVENGYVTIKNDNTLAYGNKFVILYDGSPINSDGTTDDVPATPNSAGFGEDHSTLLIIGASLAGLLVISAPIAYLIHRKKSLDKVRF